MRDSGVGSLRVLTFAGIRLLQAVPTILLILIVVFALVRLSGDPATLVLGDWASAEQVEALREEWGLSDPLPVQFGRYLWGVLHGDLGESLRYHRPVSEMIVERFPASAQLALVAIALSMLVGIPVGVVAASRWRSLADLTVRLSVAIGQAIPRFYLGTLLIVVFGLWLKWLPAGGYGSAARLILPAVTMATPTVVLLARLTRSSVLDALHKDYVRTARSKGIREGVILYRHVLRNALIPPLTMIGMEAALMFGQAVVVETVFSWPGLGRLAMNAVYTRDFPVLQGVVMAFCMLTVVAGILVDVLYAVVDPRIRY
ncbi:MAG: ABC transporter permease [Candidatus Bipolaricaulis sp.]|nr:ABC transporter permease [Candidatus Bipolaricaulis sp.]